MRVSIIVPAHNAGEFIGRCLLSIVTQTHTDWECIVVDDCSTDDTFKRVVEIIDGNPHFSVLGLERNMGVAAARNSGLACVDRRSDAVCFVDADDWCEPDMLEVMVAEATANPTAGRIVTQAKVHYPSGLVDLWLINPLGFYPTDSTHPFSGPKCDMGHVTGCLYVLRNIPFEPKFPKVALYEDMIFNMGLLLARVPVFVSRRSVYHYRRREGSLIASAPFSKADAIKCRAALGYLAALYEADEQMAARFAAFLESAMKGRIRP